MTLSEIIWFSIRITLGMWVLRTAYKLYKMRDEDGMIRIRIRIWKPAFYAVIVGLALVLMILLNNR